MSTTNKNISMRSAILPTGDAMAAFTKVAMADQMGRNLADIIFEKTAYTAGSAFVRSLKKGFSETVAKQHVAKQFGNKAADMVVSGTRDIAKVTGQSTLGTLSAGSRAPGLTGKATDIVLANNSGIMQTGVGGAKAAVTLITGKAKIRFSSASTRTGRPADPVKAKHALKGVNNTIPAEGASEASKKKWFEDSKVWAGVAGGLGVGLVGSAAMGN